MYLFCLICSPSPFHWWGMCIAWGCAVRKLQQALESGSVLRCSCCSCLIHSSAAWLWVVFEAFLLLFYSMQDIVETDFKTLGETETLRRIIQIMCSQRHPPPFKVSSTIWRNHSEAFGKQTNKKHCLSPILEFWHGWDRWRTSIFFKNSF